MSHICGLCFQDAIHLQETSAYRNSKGDVLYLHTLRRRCSVTDVRPLSWCAMKCGVCRREGYFDNTSCHDLMLKRAPTTCTGYLHRETLMAEYKTRSSEDNVGLIAMTGTFEFKIASLTLVFSHSGTRRSKGPTTHWYRISSESNSSHRFQLYSWC